MKSDSGGEMESCRSSDSELERELHEKEREVSTPFFMPTNSKMLDPVLLTKTIFSISKTIKLFGTVFTNNEFDFRSRHFNENFRPDSGVWPNAIRS